MKLVRIGFLVASTLVVAPEATGAGPTARPASDEEAAIALTGVGEVVAVPESTDRGIVRKDGWFENRKVVATKPDGSLVKPKVGMAYTAYLSEDNRFLFQGVEEAIEVDGAQTTRPLVLVQTLIDGKLVQGRYSLTIKEVKSGQDRLEAGMELYGGVRALADGVIPGTYDVYLELAVPGEAGETFFVRGTFDENDIPAVRDAAAEEESVRRAVPGPS